MDDTDRNGANYPRKRSAIACDICRAKRSKCDAKRPACSTCIDLEVDCVYKKPNLWDREPAAAAATVTASIDKVFSQLGKVQESIAVLTERVDNISRTNSISRTSWLDSSLDFGFSSPNIPAPILTPDLNFQPYQGRAGPPSYGSISASRPRGHRMPNLMSFVAPTSLGPFSYETTREFFTGEVNQGDKLFNCIEEVLENNIQADFSPQVCWRFQRAFVSGFLWWMPIFDNETCLRHVEIASSSSFADNSTSTCLTLLIFATGAMADDEHLYHEDPRTLPGFAYLALAYKILRSMRIPLGDVSHLQCRTLLAVYLTFAMRPVQAWNEINKVSREYMTLLKTNWLSDDAQNSDAKCRTFWVAYVLENELEVCLELPSSGIRTLQESLPLPTSPVDEEGMYNFLAVISLRKLLAEVIETVGFKSGHAIYVPIVAVELRNQILSWHEHLPVRVRFPLDASPLFDLRKAYLRCQFFCLQMVIYWPFVLRHVEDTNSAELESPEGVATRAAVHKRAKVCIDCCVLHLKSSEGIMMQKTLASHSSLRAFYANIMVLLFAYRPVYHCEPPPDVLLVIKRSMATMELWDKVPFMSEALSRMKQFAIQGGWDQAPVDES